MMCVLQPTTLSHSFSKINKHKTIFPNVYQCHIRAHVWDYFNYKQPLIFVTLLAQPKRTQRK